MTRNQIGITVGAVGFLVCTGVFVASFLEQLAYVEVLSCLAAWAELLIASVSALEALEDKQLKSGFPSLAGAALTFFVLAFYALSGFLRRV
jgi:hypothetical protein